MSLPGSGNRAAARPLWWWADSSPQAGIALAHPFIRGIADGSLPRPVFAGYVAQDAVFLEAFARAYALALAASPDTGTVLAFAGLISGVRDELSMHAAHAARWGVNPSTTAPNEATLSYTEFLLATAATGTVALVCAAMTPCIGGVGVEQRLELSFCVARGQLSRRLRKRL